MTTTTPQHIPVHTVTCCHCAVGWTSLLRVVSHLSWWQPFLAMITVSSYSCSEVLPSGTVYEAGLPYHCPRGLPRCTVPHVVAPVKSLSPSSRGWYASLYHCTYVLAPFQPTCSEFTLPLIKFWASSSLQQKSNENIYILTWGLVVVQFCTEIHSCCQPLCSTQALAAFR